MNLAAGFSFGTIVLGAGASSRMGRPKLLLPWGNQSILGHLISTWKHLGAAQIAVVCPPAIAPVSTELDRLQFPSENRIINPHPEQGMFSSVRCAARWPNWRTDLTHWIIVLGDQPQISRQTLKNLLEFARTQPDFICQPKRAGRSRHPVILPRQVLLELPGSPAPHLKAFLAEKEIAYLELDDPGLDFDLDAPGDYEKAVRIFTPRAN